MPFPLIPVVLGGGALLLLATGKKKSAPAGMQTTAQPVKQSDASIDSLTKVIASADPATLAKAADDLAKQGYANVAAEVRSMAAEAKAGTLAPIPVPPAASDEKTKVLAAAAAALAEMLRTAKPGTEDRKAVSAYQRLQGSLKVDGLYGPETAKSFYPFGIYPPPKPLYWPKKDTQKAKDAYAAWLKANQPKVVL